MVYTVEETPSHLRFLQYQSQNNQIKCFFEKLDEKYNTDDTLATKTTKRLTSTRVYTTYTLPTYGLAVDIFRN